MGGLAALFLVDAFRRSYERHPPRQMSEEELEQFKREIRNPKIWITCAALMAVVVAVLFLR